MAFTAGGGGGRLCRGMLTVAPEKRLSARGVVVAAGGWGGSGEGYAPSGGGWRRVVDTASAAVAHTVTPVGGGWARAGAPGRRGGARPASLSIRHRAHALCW